MKSYKEFLSESVNISGDFNGNLYINSTEKEQVAEKYSADMEWKGELYRIEVMYDGALPGRTDLTEMIQSEYPGAIIHNVYPPSKESKIVGGRRIFHDSEWS